MSQVARVPRSAMALDQSAPMPRLSGSFQGINRQMTICFASGDYLGTSTPFLLVLSSEHLPSMSQLGEDPTHTCFYRQKTGMDALERGGRDRQFSPRYHICNVPAVSVTLDSAATGPGHSSYAS